MGKSYSSDLRVRIYGAIEDGASRRAAARRYGVSPSTSVRVAQRMSATGSVLPRVRADRQAAENWRLMPRSWSVG